MTYVVTYTESLRGKYVIEANSSEEAVQNLYDLIDNGQIDTLDLDVVECNAIANLLVINKPT